MVKAIWMAIFGPLPYSDSDERRSAFLLGALLVFVAPMVSVFAAILGLQHGFELAVGLVPLIAILGSVLGAVLLRAGQLKFSAWLFISTTFLLSTWAIGTAGGPSSPAFASTFLPLAVAALVLGFRALLIVGTAIILSLAATEWMILNEIELYYKLDMSSTSVMTMRILQLVSVGGFFMLAMASEKRAIAKLRANRHELASANKKLSRQMTRQSKIAELARDVLQSGHVEDACVSAVNSISLTLHGRPVAYYSYLPENGTFQRMAHQGWASSRELLFVTESEKLSWLVSDYPSGLLDLEGSFWATWDDDGLERKSALIPARSTTTLHGFFILPCVGEDTLLTEDEAFLEGASHIIAAAYERLNAQIKVHQLEERRATMVANSPDGMVSLNSEGRILDCNNSAAKLFGVMGSKVVGLCFSDFPDLAVGVRQKFEETVTQTIQEGGSRLFEIELSIDNNKSRRQVEVRIHRVQEDGGPVNVDLFLRDISERHLAKRHAEQLELELHTARRMETIGRLAGGIAHDFNNLLTVVLMHTSVFQKRRDLPAPVLKGVEQINGSAQRAKRLVHQLLAFARRQPLAPKPLDLGALIHELEGLLRRLIPEDVAINISVNPEASLVVADHTQVEQVILNLAVNARDAMPDGGILNIRVCNSGEESHAIDFHRSRPEGDFVLLEVEDNGCGMDDVVMGQIFEPFFTTKDVGEGTGMGLATVYGVVKQHEGAVLVDSKIGKGTVFQVYWPKSDAKKAAPTISTDDEREIPTGNGERILVVDDEPLLLETVAITLKSCGYDVHTVSDGLAAMQIAEELGKIDFLVSDVVMPELGGPDLARALWSTRPELPVLFVSGYSPDRIDEILKENKNVDFLRKPFTPMQVGEKVSDMLAQLKAN